MNKREFVVGAALCATAVLWLGGTFAAPVKVSVDATKVKCEISPWLYGTGMEDVNHEIYGGLDAQRLYGESFEEMCPSGTGDSRQSHGVSASWDKAEALDGGDFIRDAKIYHQGHASQSLVPNGGVAAIANSGLRRWGVPCRAGKKMVGYVWTRGKVGKLEVALQDAWGEKTYACMEIPTQEGTNWCKAVFALTPSATDPHGRFLVRASGTGRVWLDDAYLADEPTNEFGRLGCREDIVAAFKAEGVTFLRWGGTMVNTPGYKLANMDGTGQRCPYPGYWYRESSGGFGPYEFVRMAHAMRLPCSVAINAYDAVEDAVRFATELKKYDTPIFVQIGNEELVNWAQNPEDSRTMKGVSNYCTAVKRLVPTMRAANPKLKFIQSSYMTNDAANDGLMEAVFRALDGLVEYWDVHVLTYDPAQVRKGVDNATRARELMKRWNPQTTMKVVILEENGNSHGMDRALAHAVMLEKARAMGPDMFTSCPANALQPYLHNDNWWDQGAIFFTPTSVWLSPCGQAQKLASAHHRELLVEGSTDDRDVSVSATKSRDGQSIALHFVNTARAPRAIDLRLVGADGMKVAKVLSLSGATTKADNSPAEPAKVAPRDDTEDFLRAPSLRPYSYTVVVLADWCSPSAAKSSVGRLASNASAGRFRTRNATCHGENVEERAWADTITGPSPEFRAFRKREFCQDIIAGEASGEIQIPKFYKTLESVRRGLWYNVGNEEHSQANAVADVPRTHESHPAASLTDCAQTRRGTLRPGLRPTHGIDRFRRQHLSPPAQCARSSRCPARQNQGLLQC